MDLGRSSQHCYNHVWTRLDKYWQVWTSLYKSGQVWTLLNEPGWIWTSMNESGQVWTSLDKSGWVWMILNKSERVRTSLDKHERVWTSLDKSGQVWMSLDDSGQVWTSLDKFGWVWTRGNMMEQVLTWLQWSVCFFVALLDNGWIGGEKTIYRPAGFSAGNNFLVTNIYKRSASLQVSWTNLEKLIRVSRIYINFTYY